MAFAYIISIYAVPAGVYVDKRGKPIVHINGTEIYILNTNGDVILRGTIVSETSNNTFTIQYETGISESRNSWYTDNNGSVCLNVFGRPGTLIKK